MFALDANTLIHALKGKGKVRPRLEQEDLSAVAIPAIVAYELEFGTLNSTHSSRRRRELDRIFGVLAILPFDSESARRAAQVRSDLERRGLKIGPLDLLIAGTVLAHGATLVTNNIREFSRVPGLQVEDWL